MSYLRRCRPLEQSKESRAADFAPGFTCKARACREWVAQVVQWQRGRNFEGVLSLTRDNKVHYAKLHGYDYIDASWIVSGARRPPQRAIPRVRAALELYGP